MFEGLDALHHAADRLKDCLFAKHAERE